MALAERFVFSSGGGGIAYSNRSTILGGHHLHEHSYSGADIRAVVHVDPFEDEDGTQKTTLELATLQTISISVFRDKQPVRGLGRVYEAGRVRGPRTIGGSLIFTVFDEAVLARIMRVPRNERDLASGVSAGSFRYALMDQLPPFDVTILFTNEYGFASRMALLAVDIHSEGQVMSVEDMFTENTMQFTARNMEYMHAIDRPTMEPGDEAVAPRPVPQITFSSIMKGGNAFSEKARLIRRAMNPFI